MRPRVRTILLVAAIVLVVSGLLVAGPAHMAFHGHDGGTGCEACTFQAGIPADAAPVLGPIALARLAILLPPSSLHESAPRLLPPARGPPRGV